MRTSIRMARRLSGPVTGAVPAPWKKAISHAASPLISSFTSFAAISRTTCRAAPHVTGAEDKHGGQGQRAPRLWPDCAHFARFRSTTTASAPHAHKACAHLRHSLVATLAASVLAVSGLAGAAVSRPIPAGLRLRGGVRAQELDQLRSLEPACSGTTRGSQAGGRPRAHTRSRQSNSP